MPYLKEKKVAHVRAEKYAGRMLTRQPNKHHSCPQKVGDLWIESGLHRQVHKPLAQSSGRHVLRTAHSENANGATAAAMAARMEENKRLPPRLGGKSRTTKVSRTLSVMDVLLVIDVALSDARCRWSELELLTHELVE